jgi:hypothetical protein
MRIQFRNDTEKIFTSITLMVLLTLIIVPTFGQNKKESSAIDYSRPGPYHQMLANLIGTWDFQGKFYSGNSNPDSNKVLGTFSGTLVRKSLADGRFFYVELTGGKIQMPIQDGKMKEVAAQRIEIEGFDNVKKKFVLTYINNHIGSGIVLAEGRYDSTRKTIFYEWEDEQVPGKKFRVRERFVILDNNHYKMEYYREQDGKVFKATEISCTRTN